MAKTQVDLGTQVKGSLPYSKMTINSNELAIAQVNGLQGQLDALSGSVSTFEWQESVIDTSVLNPVALTPAVGDRYLIKGVGAGAWAGKDNQIAQCASIGPVVWSYFTPIEAGTFVASDAEANRIYYWGGASWSAKDFEQTIADESTLTKSSYTLSVKALGISDSHIATLAGIVDT